MHNARVRARHPAPTFPLVSSWGVQRREDLATVLKEPTALKNGGLFHYRLEIATSFHSSQWRTLVVVGALSEKGEVGYSAYLLRLPRRNAPRNDV
jgi:hypothetical protein